MLKLTFRDTAGTVDTLVLRASDGSVTMFRLVDAGFESTATGQRVGAGKVTVGGDGWRWVGHRSTGVGIGLELDAHTACGTRLRGPVGQLLLVGLGDGARGAARAAHNQTPSAASLEYYTDAKIGVGHVCFAYPGHPPRPPLFRLGRTQLYYKTDLYTWRE